MPPTQFRTLANLSAPLITADRIAVASVCARHRALRSSSASARKGARHLATQTITAAPHLSPGSKIDVMLKRTRVASFKTVAQQRLSLPAQRFAESVRTTFFYSAHPAAAPVVSHDVHSEETQDRRAKEIKDAKLIFNQAWKNIEDRYGRENLCLPKEIIFLMGAPGSGKGTHTPSILRSRGITNPPIAMSTLLATPECKDLINKGQMVSDRQVIELLFDALLKCEGDVGVLVDGFPRTEIQVECLKLIYDKMVELRREFWATPLKDKFPRPVFRICVLYVDEDISVQRQLARGEMIRQHNAQVRRSGQGELWEERVTDSDETLIRSRYAIFKAHYGALLKLSKIFPFHLINAVGTIEQVMYIILKEFEYQSSLELDQETYDAIAHIPLATKIGIHARQDLINRLEHYQETEPEVLRMAIDFIDKEIVPQVIRHSISGHATVRTENLLLENDHLVSMIMDVLSERGYHISFDSRERETPKRVNLKTGEIEVKKTHYYALSVHFPKHHIQPLEQKFH